MDEKDLREKYSQMSMEELEAERTMVFANGLHHALDVVWHAGVSNKFSEVRSALALSYGEQWVLLGDIINERNLEGQLEGSIS